MRVIRYDGKVLVTYEMRELQAPLCCGKGFPLFVSLCFPSLSSTTSQIYPVSHQHFLPSSLSGHSRPLCVTSLRGGGGGLSWSCKVCGCKILSRWDLLRKCPDRNCVLSCSLETPTYFKWESPITFRCFGGQSGNGPFYLEVSEFWVAKIQALYWTARQWLLSAKCVLALCHPDWPLLGAGGCGLA